MSSSTPILQVWLKWRVFMSVRGLLLEKTPGMLSLLAARPNTSTFSITSISFNLTSPFNPSEEEIVTIGGPRSSANLHQALQYSSIDGHSELNNWLSDFQAYVHNV